MGGGNLYPGAFKRGIKTFHKTTEIKGNTF